MSKHLKLFKLFLIVSLLWCSYTSYASANVTLNTAGTTGHTTGVTATPAYSVAVGSNTVAFAYVCWDNTSGKAITAITYASAAMTSAGAASTNATGFGYCQIFYKIAPATGSNTLSITATAATSELYYNLVAFNGVDQTTPVRPGSYQNLVNVSSDTSSHASVTITSNVTDLTTTVSMNSTGSSVISSTNQTINNAVNTVGNYSAANDRATTAASSVTHTWTTSVASTPVVIAGFSIQAVQSSAVVSYPKIALLSGKLTLTNGLLSF